MAIQGFDSAVTSIVNGGGTPSDSSAPEGSAAYSEEAAQLLETLEAALLAQCQSISEMLAMVGWGDAAFLYELIDDTRYFNYGDTALECFYIFYYDGRAVVHTKWELPDQQEEP